MGDENRDHWNALGGEYSENWSSPAQQLLSEKETSFVIQHVPSEVGQAVLDVGIGNGRILEKLIAREEVGAVYGVDVAPQMVEFCREKFAGDPKLKALSVCDVAREPLPVPQGFGFVSAIRVLKYSDNWWDIVQKLVAHLAPGGVLVFTMPNSQSLKRFSRPYAVEYFKTTTKDLQERLSRSDVDLLEISGFSKLPDVLYRRCKHPTLASSLLTLERQLDRAVGSGTLSRELFIAVRRKA